MFRRGPVGGVAGGRFGKSPWWTWTWDLGPWWLRDRRGLGVCMCGQTGSMWDIETCRVRAAAAAGRSCTELHWSEMEGIWPG